MKKSVKSFVLASVFVCGCSVFGPPDLSFYQTDPYVPYERGKKKAEIEAHNRKVLDELAGERQAPVLSTHDSINGVQDVNAILNVNDPEDPQPRNVVRRPSYQGQDELQGSRIRPVTPPQPPEPVAEAASAYRPYPPDERETGPAEPAAGQPTLPKPYVPDEDEMFQAGKTGAVKTAGGRELTADGQSVRAGAVPLRPVSGVAPPTVETKVVTSSELIASLMARKDAASSSDERRKLGTELAALLLAGGTDCAEDVADALDRAGRPDSPLDFRNLLQLRHKADTGDFEGAGKLAHEVARDLAVRAGIRIPKALFVSKLDGFGSYTPVDTLTFKRGGVALLYFEVANFSSKKVAADRFMINLSFNIIVLDAVDNIVGKKIEQAHVHPYSSERTDFFSYVRMQMPADVNPGVYTLKIKVVDGNYGDAGAEKTIVFQLE